MKISRKEIDEFMKGVDEFLKERKDPPMISVGKFIDGLHEYVNKKASEKCNEQNE